MWLYNRDLIGGFFAKGEWLVLSLHRLLRTIRPLPYIISELYEENIARELVKLHQENKLFSLVPIQLAKATSIKQEDNTNAQLINV
jgi:hypothetical protein